MPEVRPHSEVMEASRLDRDLSAAIDDALGQPVDSLVSREMDAIHQRIEDLEVRTKILSQSASETREALEAEISAVSERYNSLIAGIEFEMTEMMTIVESLRAQQIVLQRNRL